MKPKFIIAALFKALICAVVLTGCSKHASSAQTTLDIAAIPTTVNQVFDKAPDETKQQATSYVAAIQGQDATTAFTQLQKLKAQNNLSPEQRVVVAKAMQTTVKQLQVAAQSGNTAAQAALHKYLSSR